MIVCICIVIKWFIKVIKTFRNYTLLLYTIKYDLDQLVIKCDMIRFFLKIFTFKVFLCNYYQLWKLAILHLFFMHQNIRYTFVVALFKTKDFHWHFIFSLVEQKHNLQCCDGLNNVHLWYQIWFWSSSDNIWHFVQENTISVFLCKTFTNYLWNLGC